MTARRVLTPEEYTQMAALVAEGASRDRIVKTMHVGRAVVNRTFPDLKINDPRFLRYVMTPEERARIQADIEAGLSLYALSKKYHHSDPFLLSHFPDIMVNPYALRAEGWSPELVAKLEAAFEDGWPVGEICATYGVSQKAVRHRFKHRPDYPNQREGLREAQIRRHLWEKIHQVWDLPGGPTPFVRASGRPKITQDKVQEIKRLSALGFSSREVAAQVGVARATVTRYVRGLALAPVAH